MVTKYRGATIAACESIWLKRLLKDLNETTNDQQSDTSVVRASNLHEIQGSNAPICVIIIMPSWKKPVRYHYFSFYLEPRLLVCAKLT